jgi:tRNA modification GTPase
MDKITDFSRTITALATALGSGSIAVIRISGPDAISIVDTIFSGKNLNQVDPNTIHYGRIVAAGKVYDQVLVSVFHAPNSYTGENYAEISCHANPYIADDIIDVLMEQGARAAKAGEFTLRAFLNGKMDLSQAEAVAAIIQAKSRIGVRNSLDQLHGKLAERILQVKEKLIEVIGLIELDLDFSEDDVQITAATDIVDRLKALERDLTLLKSSYNYAKLLDDGIHLTIIGEPNAGKSTLLNHLLGENRAITSHIPGTTRDTIRENVIINNVLFNLVDTAGLRRTRDTLEAEGIKRTHSQTTLADLVLLLVDSSKEISPTSWKLIRGTVEAINSQVIIVANKTDLGMHQSVRKKLQLFKKEIVDISAKKGIGISDLKTSILNHVFSGLDNYSDNLIITSKRQKEAMSKTVKNIHNASKTLQKGESFEFAAVDLRQALNDLGEITGETVTDDILHKVFSNFCIGK